jgi:hypothetical protein
MKNPLLQETAFEHFIKRYSPENRVKPQVKQFSSIRHSSDTFRDSTGLLVEPQAMK